MNILTGARAIFDLATNFKNRATFFRDLIGVSCCVLVGLAVVALCQGAQAKQSNESRAESARCTLNLAAVNDDSMTSGALETLDQMLSEKGLPKQISIEKPLPFFFYRWQLTQSIRESEFTPINYTRWKPHQLDQINRRNGYSNDNSMKNGFSLLGKTVAGIEYRTSPQHPSKASPFLFNGLVVDISQGVLSIESTGEGEGALRKVRSFDLGHRIYILDPVVQKGNLLPHLIERTMADFDLDGIQKIADNISATARGVAMNIIEGIHDLIKKIGDSENQVRDGGLMFEVYEQLIPFSMALTPQNRISMSTGELKKEAMEGLVDQMVVIGLLRAGVGGSPQSRVEIIAGRVLGIGLSQDGLEQIDKSSRPARLDFNSIPWLKIQSCTSGNACIDREIPVADRDRLFILRLVEKK